MEAAALWGLRQARHWWRNVFATAPELSPPRYRDRRELSGMAFGGGCWSVTRGYLARVVSSRKVVEKRPHQISVPLLPRMLP